MPKYFIKNGKKVRDYKREYKMYHGKPEQLKNRTKRNQARKRINAARKARGLPALRTNQEVDHVRPISKGGGNGVKNTRVTTRTKNRRKYNK